MPLPPAQLPASNTATSVGVTPAIALAGGTCGRSAPGARLFVRECQRYDCVKRLHCLRAGYLAPSAARTQGRCPADGRRSR